MVEILYMKKYSIFLLLVLTSNVSEKLPSLNSLGLIDKFKIYKPTQQKSIFSTGGDQTLRRQLETKIDLPQLKKGQLYFKYKTGHYSVFK